MNGTIINVSAIFLFGLLAILTKRELSEGIQEKLRKVLGCLTLLLGLVMMYNGFSWSDGIIMLLKQFGIFYLSALLGILVGTTIRIEKFMASLTTKAHAMFSQSMDNETSMSAARGNSAEGFKICTILFCIGPIAILGAVLDGATGNLFLLVIKSVLDGVSVMSFARFYGYGAVVAAIPVGVMQGTIALLCMAFFRDHLTDLMKSSVNMSGGFLVISMALVILGARKIPIANYLPSLFIAPLLTWWWLT